MTLNNLSFAIAKGDCIGILASPGNDQSLTDLIKALAGAFYLS